MFLPPTLFHDGLGYPASHVAGADHDHVVAGNDHDHVVLQLSLAQLLTMMYAANYAWSCSSSWRPFSPASSPLLDVDVPLDLQAWRMRSHAR